MEWSWGFVPLILILVFGVIMVWNPRGIYGPAGRRRR